ncbi:MAG: T9SS type A sorting domain-containing protein [Bacteroidia bacterium]|nr:T9SS type A sorting domain-containing protein [Bacteroidia bacterium]
MKAHVKVLVLGLWLASHQVNAQRCDSLRLAFRGRWHWNGDTLYIQGGFLTAYPRLGPIGPTPPPGHYTWFWHLNQLVGGTYQQSGTLTGGNPTLSVPLNFSAHPTFYELRLRVIGNSPSGTSYCTDSIRIIIRGDTFPPNPATLICQDSVWLRIGGVYVRRNRAVTLPLGSYPIAINYSGNISRWWVSGPSPSQGGSPTGYFYANTPFDTVHFTAPGRHFLTVYAYIHYCIDTFTYIVDILPPSHTQNCADTSQVSPCLPQIIVNNASYLPYPFGGFFSLASGVYTFHIQPAHHFPNTVYQYEWVLSGATIPGGAMSGTSSSISAYIGLASYILTVRVRAFWPCPITQSCDRTYTFIFSGGGTPNDTIHVTHPLDTTTYSPGDTLPLPLDTVCLYGGVQTLHPDSVYWWYWTYYGPNGQPLDSGITPVSCVYPVGGGGVYWITYGLTPPPTGRLSQQRRYTFYLKFGGRLSAVEKSPLQSVALYPNPATGSVWLRLPEEKLYSVSILDPTGRELHRMALQGGEPQLIPLSLPSGVYVVKVEYGEQVQVLRLLIQ